MIEILNAHANAIVLSIAFLSVAGQAILDRRHARRARTDKV